MLSRTVRSSLLLSFLGLSAAVGCGGGLKLKLVNQSAGKPSNVAVYFAVDTSGGEPVPGLTADKFVIYEDGQKVSEFESKQTILNPTVAAAHYTLLLVDMSGSIVESKSAPKVVDAAAKFTAKVGKYQKVGVAAFDGSPELTGVVPFTESGTAAQSGLDKLLTFKPKDPSTNLHGAVVEGLKTLRKALDAEPKPLKFGTLVVFTDGSDRANRVSRDDMRKSIQDDKHKDFDIYAIGVGPEQEMKGSKLDEIGKTGTVYESDPQKTDQAFDKIATKIEGMTQRYYLLSYCTPSRAGEHEVEIEAKTDKGSGSVKYKFKADGFGPNCDPNTPPPFDLAHPVDPKPASGGGGSASGSVKVEKK
jgi:hypothetical protein